MEKVINLSLKQQQNYLMDVLYTFDDFCKSNNINYYIISGTLLGAVRHQGFIPWDDDVDVMIPRDDYDRFEKLVNRNPPNGYKAYSINNTKGYYYPFIKFGKLDLYVKEFFPYVPTIALSIDVFPIDGCPNDLLLAQEFVRKSMTSILDA